MKSGTTNIMALLLDMEPPSSEKERDDDKTQASKQLLNPKFKAFSAQFVKNCRGKFQRLYFLWQKAEKALKTASAKSTDNKVLPHIAIVFLFIVVAFSNINDRVQAYYLTHEINNIDPNVELAIVSDVDPYTPNISADTESVEKSISTSGYSSGFIYNASPTDTQITARTEPLPDNSKETVYYVVRNNDTLSGIGWQFGVKLATLAYINELSNTNVIKPGVRLKVPPRGYEVPVSQIAQREKDKAKKAALASATTNSSNKNVPKGAITRPAGSSKNAYPFGWCTYYVATRRAVPGQWGNAGQWLNSAKRAGYPTGGSAVTGSIVVMNQSIWGHVAYVESVNGNEMTISEMNAPIWGVRTTRTINTSDRSIKGFVY